jgi:hypothetical protein
MTGLFLTSAMIIAFGNRQSAVRIGVAITARIVTGVQTIVLPQRIALAAPCVLCGDPAGQPKAALP